MFFPDCFFYNFNTCHKKDQPESSYGLEAIATSTKGFFLARMLRARRVGRIHPVWVYPRPQHWLEEMLNNRALNSLWKRHFRVSRAGTFHYICGIQRQNKRFLQAIPLQKRVAIALWRLGSGNSYRSTAITLGIGESSAIKICYSFSEAINRRKNDFISSPVHEDDIKETISKFEEKQNKNIQL